jgi:toxin FitB
MIIADTNVVSELMRVHPDERILSWVAGLAVAEIATTAITVEEIERGIMRLPSGKRQRELRGIWSQLLTTYADNVRAFDIEAAIHAATLTVGRDRDGRRVELADAQIAGICVSRGATLATRNTKDFEGIDGLALVNPFDPALS